MYIVNVHAYIDCKPASSVGELMLQDLSPGLFRFFLSLSHKSAGVKTSKNLALQLCPAKLFAFIVNFCSFINFLCLLFANLSMCCNDKRHIEIKYFLKNKEIIKDEEKRE